MYSKIKLTKVRFYDYEKECWMDTNACLESDAIALVNRLENQIFEERKKWNTLSNIYRSRRKTLREKLSALYKKCEEKDLALRKLRVAFADAMRQIWDKEGELCDRDHVSSIQAYTLRERWNFIKNVLKRRIPK